MAIPDSEFLQSLVEKASKDLGVIGQEKQELQEDLEDYLNQRNQLMELRNRLKGEQEK